MTQLDDTRSASWISMVARWYADNARDLPWRRDGVDAWGVLVCEVMSQQTPVARVAPAWEAWMRRWPTPGDLAQASPAEVITAWDRLGYPRRALRLRECAQAIVSQHAGRVPGSYEELVALPGVGDYTASAVCAFAYGQRIAVLDTNVRRVLGRVLDAQELPRPHMRVGERQRALDLLPCEPSLAAHVSAGLMEMGALLCQARTQVCREAEAGGPGASARTASVGPCPLMETCAWRAAGYPQDSEGGRRRPQAFEGTDRQARGQVMALMRGLAAGETATRQQCEAVAVTSVQDPQQPARAVTSLLADGLIVEDDAGGGLRLPQ